MSRFLCNRSWLFIFFALFFLYQNSLDLFAQIPWVEKNNGIDGGRVNTVIQSGSDLFAGTDGGGIFLQAGGTTSWVKVSSGLTNKGYFVYSLAAGGNNIFAGTSDGVFLSNNKGASWSQINTGIVDTDIRAIAVNGSTVYAGSYVGIIYVSTNNGASWTAKTLPNNNTSTVISFAVNGGNVYAGTYGGGLFLSNDGGVNWSAANTGLTSKYVSSFLVNGSTIYIGTSSGIFTSTDNGASWTQLPGLTSFYIYSLALNGNNLYAGSGTGIFVSADNGASWTALNYQITAIALLANGTTLLAGTSNGFFSSTDAGKNWSTYSSGFNALPVSEISATGNTFFAGDAYNLYRSTDGGSTWTSCNAGIPIPLTGAILATPSYVFVGASNKLFRSSDNGLSWTPLVNPSSYSINAMITLGNDIALGTLGGVCVSPDNGATWTRDTTLTYVAALAANGNALLAGTSPAFGNGRVYISNDHGVTWTATSPFPSNLAHVRALAASGTNIIASTSIGLFVSQDTGATWVNANISTTNNYFTGAAFINGNPVVSGYGGIFYSTDNGTTWSPVNAGLPTLYISCLSLGNSTLLAGGFGAGVWARPISDLCKPATPLVSVTNGASITLSSSAASGNQWYLNGSAIVGAVNENYTTKEAGIYAVQVTVGDCSSTSSDYILKITEIVENNFQSNLHPNPAKSQVTLSLGSPGELKEVSLFNSNGGLLTTQSLDDEEVHLAVGSYSPGIYIAHVVSGGKTRTIRFVKE